MSQQSTSFEKPEPQIVTLGPLLLAGARYQGRNEHGEIPAMWDGEFIPRLGELGPLMAGHELYGVARALPGPWTGEYEYLACAPVTSLEGLPDGMVGWELPAGTYAMAPCNDVPDIGRVHGYIRDEWLGASNEYRAADGPFVELYPETYPQDGKLLIHVAVERR